MNVPAGFMALTGLALGVYAALCTETEDIRRRAILGGTGVVLMAVGLAFI